MKNPVRILLLLMFITGLLGAAVTGALVYSRLIYLSVLMTLAGWLWSYLSLLGIRVRRHARSLRAKVGDTFEESFEIANMAPIARLWLEVSNDAGLPSAAGSRVLTNIGPREKRSYTARTWLTRRGSFVLGPTVIASGDPFGLFKVRRAYPGNESLLVLPMLVGITAFPSPPGLLPGGKAIRRKSYDITPHAAGVREYVTGDPMKRIHWPTTARRGQLMVKEFEQDPQAEIWLFLDAFKEFQLVKPYDEPGRLDWLFSDKPKINLPPATMEYSVCIAASLAHYFLGQRRAVGLVSAGQVLTVIPAERSERQEIKILETLAFLQGDGSVPLAGLVSMQASQFPLGSSVVLITPSIRNEVVVAVDELQRRNLNPVVILLDAQSFGGEFGTSVIAQSLAQRSVPVCTLACDDDISKVLSNFAAQSSYQEIYQWQKPPYIPSN